MNHPEMDSFWQKTGWATVFAIEALALILGLVWTDNLSRPAAGAWAALLVSVWLVVVCSWYFVVPYRCRKCGRIYDICDHIGWDGLEDKTSLDTSVCPKCSN